MLIKLAPDIVPPIFDVALPVEILLATKVPDVIRLPVANKLPLTVILLNVVIYGWLPAVNIEPELPVYVGNNDVTFE